KHRAVMRAEIVAPMADAMRLVNHHERDLGLPDEPLEPRRIATLRRDINQLVQPAFYVAEAPPHFRRGKRAVQISDVFKAAPRHRVNLVLHQRDQRRNYQRQSAYQLSRQLVTKGFAEAGRQHRERVATSQRVFNHLTLVRAELLETEKFAQRAFKFVYFHGGLWLSDIEYQCGLATNRHHNFAKSISTSSSGIECARTRISQCLS